MKIIELQKLSYLNLCIALDEDMAEQARRLIEHVQLEETETLPKNEILDIITTIVANEFSSLSREEVEAILGLTLEQTRVYQEAKAEGREEREAEMLRAIVPLLLKMGVSVEQMAQNLNVDVESVRLAPQQNTK